jgi:membrane-bound lytic murein transglycosylase D
LRYGLLVIAGVLLSSACRTASKPARTPAPTRAPTPVQTAAPPTTTASPSVGGAQPSARRPSTSTDSSASRERRRAAQRVAAKPSKRTAKSAPAPAKPAPSGPQKETPSTGGVTVAGAPAGPRPVTTPSPAPGVIKAPLPPRLDGSAARGGDATAVARVPKDSNTVSESEVSRRAVEVFGDSMSHPVPRDSARAPEAEPTNDAEAEAEEVPTWDIDVASYETHARVERYVRMFSGPARERIVQQLEAGSRYEPMIRAKFRQGGLPEDMYYLALVESGYNPHAYSKAAAVGMWQFMVSTARGLGLRVDWWVDERRDPVRSTWAAVRFLRGLRAQFGSLYLAAAAYNGGPGRVARGLSRYDLDGATGDDRFFALADKGYLHRETREYVPQLIAAALIAKDPARYGIKLYALPPFEYDSVRVGPQTPLAAVALAAGTSVAAIQDLNPHVLRGMTPPGKPFQVRVPVGMAVDFDSAFATLTDSQRTAVRRVVVKKAESLTMIARRAGIRTKDLDPYNPTLARSRTKRAIPGQVLLVPTPATAAAARSVPDPLRERHPRASGPARIHTVRPGENLAGIADRYGTTTAALMRLNRLKRPVIFPGQTLVISGRRRR